LETKTNTKVEEALEMQKFYQELAEKYRGEFLKLERDFEFYKHTVQYEIQKSANADEVGRLTLELDQFR